MLSLKRTTLKFDGFGFFSWVRIRFWLVGWVEMNGIISTSTNTKNTKKKKKSKTSLGPHNCKNKKSVQVCNGCRGRHRIESPFPLSKRPKKKRKTKFGDRTQKHYLHTKREKDSSSCSERKREKNIKNTNTLNMDVACEAIDGLALLYLPR